MLSHLEAREFVFCPPVNHWPQAAGGGGDTFPDETGLGYLVEGNFLDSEAAESLTKVGVGALVQ